MASYAITQLDEEEALGDLRQPPAVPSSRRRFGLVALLFGSIGLIGALLGRASPEQHLTALQHASLMTKTFMTAFCSRHLTQNGRAFGADINFLWAEEGAAEPGNMTVEAALQLAEKEHKLPEIVLVFLAKRGQTNNLISHLENIKAELHSLLAEEDGTGAAVFNRSVSISVSDADSSSVVVKLVGPPGVWGDSEATLEAAQAPTFRAKLAFGRTISEMLSHLDDNVMVLPAGIKASFHTSLGMKLLAGLEAVGRLGELDEVFSPASRLLSRRRKHELREVVHHLRAISSIGMDTAIRYRREDLLKAMPVPAQVMLDDLALGAFAMTSMLVPSALLAAFYRLTTSWVGLQAIELRGLPENWELLLKFTNFSVSSLLTALFPGDWYGLLPDSGKEPSSEVA